jgi:hypothetical protein
MWFLWLCRENFEEARDKKMVGGRASAALLLAALCCAGLHGACTEAAQHAAVQESVADYAWLREPKLEQMQGRHRFIA